MPTREFSIFKFAERFGTDEQCRHYFAYIRWQGKPRCVDCQSTELYTHKKAPLYTCKNCSKQFQATTNSIFANTGIPLRKWFLAYYFIALHKKGISSVQLSKYCGVRQKTAWRMMQKIFHVMGDDNVALFTGDIEGDETYYGPKVKGSRKGRGTDKLAIFGLLQRDGKLVLKHVEKVDRKTLQGIIEEYVEVGSTVMTDEFKSYIGLDKLYVHQTVKHSSWEYVRGNVHTNGIEGIWSHLKGGFLKGTHQRVGKRYIDLYFNVFAFRFNNRKAAMEIQFRTALALSTRKVKDSDIIRK